MSEDEEVLELLTLLRRSLVTGSQTADSEPETRVLEGAEYVYSNSIDVAIDSSSTKAAASKIWELMQGKQYSTATWSAHELHPKTKDEKTVDIIFTVDLLNFCFWSEQPADQRFAIEYRGQKWTGYWSLVAALQRALDEGVCYHLKSSQTEAKCLSGR